MDDTQIIILAAGKGTRMGGEQAKALTPLGDKTMIDYVMESALSFNAMKPITIVGYQSDTVKEHLGDDSFFVVQEEQKGTGHAVMVARDVLEQSNANTIIILYADQPFVSRLTLEKLTQLRSSKQAPLVIATALIHDDQLFSQQFYNFGRIVRDENNCISKIVEKKDASEKELAIREVNPAYFCLDKKWALECLATLDNNNAQREYYLTDLVKIAFNQGLEIPSVQIDEREALGANTPEQLAVLEKFLEN